MKEEKKREIYIYIYIYIYICKFRKTLIKGGGVSKSLETAETADASKYCKLKQFTQKIYKEINKFNEIPSN